MSGTVIRFLVAIALALGFTPASAQQIGNTGTPILQHTAATALGTSLIAKAAAGNLAGFNCTSVTGGVAGFCVAYNAATVPATGGLVGAQVLDVCAFDTSARGCSLIHIGGMINYSTGIVILVTSAANPFTYTTGSDTAFISADYQ